MDNLIILDTDRRYFPSTNLLISKAYKILEDVYLSITYRYFIIPSVKKHLTRGDTKIIAADKETEFILKRAALPFSLLNEYIREWEFIEQEKISLAFIRSIPQIVPELEVQYQGLSLWRFDEYIMFEKFFPIILQNIETLNRILMIEKPKRMLIYNSSSKWGMLQKRDAGYSNKLKIGDKTDILSSLRKIIFELFTPWAVRALDFSFMKTLKSVKYLPQKNKRIIFFESERMYQCHQSLLKKLNPDLTILQDEEYLQKNKEFSFDSIHQYIDEKAKKRLQQLRKKLIKQLRTVKRSPKVREQLTYKGIPLFEAVRDALDYLFVLGYLKSAYYVECINNYLDFNKPDLVIIMCEDPKRQKIAAELAREKGIKTLLLMHGTIGERDVMYTKLFSNQIAVYGNYYKKILIGMGYPPDNIKITGNPAWDNIHQITIKRNALYSRLGLSPDKKIILLATTHFPLDIRDGMAHATFKAMSKLPSRYHLVIKLHPEEGKEFYNACSEEFKIQATIVNELSLLHPLIISSELVIISDSTVGIETILLDRPVIDINLSPAPFWNDYVENGAALGVRREEELLPVMQSVLSNKKVRRRLEKNRKKYIYNHAYKQDGKAAERVAKMIRNIIKE